MLKNLLGEETLTKLGSSGSDTEDDGDSQILSDALNSTSGEEEDDESCSSYCRDIEEEEDDQQGTYYVFKEENPYKVADVDEENRVYQVIGNDLILLTRAEGVCCICSNIQQVLYADNSSSGNIPIQICLSCVRKIVE